MNVRFGAEILYIPSKNLNTGGHIGFLFGRRWLSYRLRATQI